MRINDGLSNVVTGIGTDRSKAYSTTYTAPVQQTQVYINAFRSSKIARRIVEQPAKDAFRKWRTWQSANDAQITAIEATEKRLDARGKLEQCMVLARLMGKAYLYISVKGDEERTEEPLVPERVKRDGITFLQVLTKSEIVESDVDTNALSPTYGMPAYYEVVGNGQLVRIHPSRLIIFYGAEKPYEFLTAKDADSVLTAILPAVARHELIVDTVGDMTQEACVDVITVPDLWQLMQDPEQQAQVITRFQEMKRLKSNNRVTLLNGSATESLNSETWQTKQISFATLPDVIRTDQEELCAAAEMPRALLFGTSAGGLGSTGDLELSNYYDRINTLQTNEIQPAINILDECIIRSALGSRPAEVWYQWESLWQVSDKEKAEIGKMVADKWKVAVDAGLPAEAAIPSLVTDLTERGVGGGVEKHFADWLATGGDLSEEDIAQDNANQEQQQTNVTDAVPRTMYVYRKVKNADDILAWAREQGMTDLLEADDLHVTIAYSRAPVDWIKMGQAWGDDMEIEAGGPRVVEELGGGAKALLFAHHSLYWRNKDMRDLGASWDWPDYQPHVTLTYGDMPGDVDPYKGPIILGPEIFEEVDDD